LASAGNSGNPGWEENAIGGWLKTRMIFDLKRIEGTKHRETEESQ